MRSHRPRLNIDALIFACHDVLIDVTYSYEAVAGKTVQIYLERALGLTPSKTPLVAPEDIHLLRKVGQFTSYWDLTKALLIYFVEMLPPVPVPTFPSKFHVPALMAYLQMAAGNLREDIDAMRTKSDIASLAADIGAAGGGIDGAHKTLPKENRHMLIFDGDITKSNLTERIFQELYLGADWFERVYGQPAIIVQSTGYAEHESLVIDRTLLDELGQKIALGLVSDRPRSEVERSLKAQQIDRYFQVAITLDEAAAARGRPVPDPWPLLETVRRLQPAPARSAYIGANVGDIQAARAAANSVPFSAIGCLVDAHDKSALQQAFETYKANIILGHPNHVKELILG